MMKERLKTGTIGEGFDGTILSGVMLSEYTSLKIGGRAEELFIPADPPSLKALIESLAESGRDYMVIGGGTNLLIADEGIDEAVIALSALKGMEVVEDSGDELVLDARPGLPLQRLVTFCREEGLIGVEGLAGIPGSLGGALFGNAGAFGYEIMDVVESVTVLEGGIVSVLRRSEISASYRNGGFSGTAVILGARLRFRRDDPEAVRERTAGFLRMKKMTQPVGLASAGCVFKNPPEGAAGRLIESAGCKGMRVGDIEVSAVHANFFVNRGRGRARDFLLLMETVASRVCQSFGIILEPEIRIVGRNVPGGIGR